MANPRARFVLVPATSVKLQVEGACGYEVSDEIAALLSEDVSYRLREVTQNASEYMRQAKRTKLTTEDLNRAEHIEPAYGFGSMDVMPFKSVSGKGEVVYFCEDKDISLKESVANPMLPLKVNCLGIRSQWLAVEGVATTDKSRKDSLSMSGDFLITTRSLTEEMKEYYKGLCSALLDQDKERLQIAVTEFRTSPHVSCVLPHLINFITSASSSLIVSCPDTPVNTDIMVDMVRVVVALAENSSVSLHPYLSELIAVCKRCVTDAAIVSSSSCIHDHWILRERGASAVAMLIGRNGLLKSDVSDQLLTSFQQLFTAGHSQLPCLFGAITGIKAFGVSAIERYLAPCAGSLLSCIEAHLGGVAEMDAIMVQGALKAAVGQLLLSQFQPLCHYPICPRKQAQEIPELGGGLKRTQIDPKELFDLLGECLTLHELEFNSTTTESRVAMLHSFSEASDETPETVEYYNESIVCGDAKEDSSLLEQGVYDMTDAHAVGLEVSSLDQNRDLVHFQVKPGCSFIRRGNSRCGWIPAKQLGSQ